MLAMSSTTIIYKAFDDLALRSQKFSSEVLSVLVLEDILGILLMVVLSAMAVSRTFEGAQLLGNLLQLSFFPYNMVYRRRIRRAYLPSEKR